MDWNTYYEEKLQVIREYKHDFRTDDPCLILGWLVDFFPDDLEFIEENAFHLFAKAGGEENDQSITDMNECFEQAVKYRWDTTDKGRELYIRWLTRAAELGHIKAAHILGFYYLKENRTPEWFETGINYLKYCIFTGNDYRSAYDLFFFLKNTDMEQALYYLKLAADHDIVQAQYDYALIYYNKGDATAYIEAVKYFSLAAAKGNTMAMYYLALCNQYGYGLMRNPSTAREWLERAAALGLGKAREILNAL